MSLKIIWGPPNVISISGIFSESKIDHGNDYEEQYIKARALTNRTSVFQI